jgi:DnaJ-domain-containing protein 1
VQDKTLADGHNALCSSYLATKASYLESAAYYTGLGKSDMAKHYKQLASDQGALASQEKTAYNQCLADENKDKAAYAASRTKYQALLAGE